MPCISVFYVMAVCVFMSWACSAHRDCLPCEDEIYLPYKAGRVSLSLPDYSKSYLSGVSVHDENGDSIVLYESEWRLEDTVGVKEVSGDWFHLTFRPVQYRVDLDVKSNHTFGRRGLKIRMKRMSFTRNGREPYLMDITTRVIQRTKYWRETGKDGRLWKKEFQERVDSGLVAQDGATICVSAEGDSIVVMPTGGGKWSYLRVSARHRATDSVTVYGPKLWNFSYDPDARDIDAGWFRAYLPDGEGKLLCAFAGNPEVYPRCLDICLVNGSQDTFRVSAIQKARRRGMKLPVRVKETAVYIPVSQKAFSIPLSTNVWTYLTRVNTRTEGGVPSYFPQYMKKVHREDSLKTRRVPFIHPRFYIDFRPDKKRLDFTEWQKTKLRITTVMDFEMKTVRPASPGGKEEIGDETIYVVLRGKPYE